MSGGSARVGKRRRIELSASCMHRLKEPQHVAEAKGERLQTLSIVVCQGHVIGHKHVRIVDFLVDPDGFHEIDVALVWVNLQKIVAVAANVPEMNVEYFLSRSEVTDDVKDFLPGVCQHLRNRSLAEVEAVEFAFLDGDELLQALDGPQHAIDPLISLGWHAGIVRMTSHADLIFVGYRNDTFEKVGDAHPESVGIHIPGSGQRFFRM